MKKFLPLFVFPAFIFAQEAVPSPANSQGGLTQTLIMIGVALVFFYLILWRPEQKRRKTAESMRNTLKKGDKVTAMAIVGTIDRIGEQTVVLKMIDGSKIEMLKAAITDVQPSSSTVEIIEN